MGIFISPIHSEEREQKTYQLPENEEKHPAQAVRLNPNNNSHFQAKRNTVERELGYY